MKNLLKLIPDKDIKNNEFGILSGVSKTSKQKSSQPPEGSSEHLQIRKLKLKFVSIVHRFNPDWKKDPLFKKNKTLSKSKSRKKTPQMIGLKSQGSEKNTFMQKSVSNFFVNMKAAQTTRGHAKNRKSEVNIIRHLLSEQENRLNQKLMSKRLKSQRENYLLKSNQDIEDTNSRAIMTSLQKVRNFDRVQSEVKFHNAGKFLFDVNKCRFEIYTKWNIF